MGSYVGETDTISFSAFDTFGWNIELKGIKNENGKFVLKDTTEFYEEEIYYFWYPRSKRGIKRSNFILQLNFTNSRIYILGKDSLIYAFVLKDTLRIGLAKRFSMWNALPLLDTLSIPDVSSIYDMTFMNNYIYITADGNRIFKIKYGPTNSQPNQTGKLGTVEIINQDFSEPKGIIGKNGNLYLVESGNSKILKIDENFNVLKVIRDTGLIYPIDIEIDRENYIWVTDKGKEKVIKMDDFGNTILEIGEAGYEVLYMDSLNTLWGLKSNGGYERWTKTGNKIEIKEEYPLGEAIGFNIEEPETPILYSVILSDTTYLDILIHKFLPAGGLFGKIEYRNSMPGGDVKFIDYKLDYSQNQGDVKGWFMAHLFYEYFRNYAEPEKWYPLDSLLFYIIPFVPGMHNRIDFCFNIKRDEILSVSPEIYIFEGIYTFFELQEIYREDIFKNNFEPGSSWDTLLTIPSSPFILPGKYVAQLSLYGKGDFPLGINSLYFFDITADSFGLKISPEFSLNPFKGDSSSINLKIWNFTPFKRKGNFIFLLDNDTIFKDSVTVDTSEIKSYTFKIFMGKDRVNLLAEFLQDTFYYKDSLSVFPSDIDVIPEISSPSEFYYDSIPFKLFLKPYSAEGKLFALLYFQKDTIRDTFRIRLGDTVSVNYYLKPSFAKDDTIYLNLSTYTQNRLYPLKGLIFRGGGEITADTEVIAQDTSFTFGYIIKNPSNLKTVYKTYFYLVDVNSDTIRFYSKEDTLSGGLQKESSLDMSVPHSGIYKIFSVLKEKNSEMLLDTLRARVYANLVNYITVDTLILKGADEEGNMKFIFPVHLPYAQSQFLKLILTHPAGADTQERYVSHDDTVKFSVFPSWDKGEYNIGFKVLNMNDNVLYSSSFRKRLSPMFYLETKDTFYTSIEDSLLSVPVIIKNKGTAKGLGFCEVRWFEDFGYAEFSISTDSFYTDTFYLLNPDYLGEGTYTITFNLNDRTEYRWVKFKGYHLSVSPFTDKNFYSKGDTAIFYLKIKNMNDLNPKVLTTISLPFYEDDTLMFITGFSENIRFDSIGIGLEDKNLQGIYISPLFSSSENDTIRGILYSEGNKILKLRKCNIYGKAETDWNDTIYPPIHYYQFRIFIPENDTFKCDSIKLFKRNDTIIKEFPRPEKIISFKFSLDSLPVRLFYGLYLWPSMRGILLRDYPIYEGDSLIAVYPEKPEYKFGDTIRLNVFSKEGGILNIHFWDNDSIFANIYPGDTFFYKILPLKGLSGSYEINYRFKKDTILLERSFEIEIKGIEINIKNLTVKPDTIYPGDSLRISMQAYVPYLVPETTFIYFYLIKDDTIPLGGDTLFLNKGINLLEFSYSLPSVPKGQGFLKYELIADSLLNFYAGKWINIGSIDTVPPYVSFIYPERVYEDDSIIIRAKVFDENEISDTIFYRIKGNIEWNKITGERENDSTFIYKPGEFPGGNEIEFYGIFVDSKGNLKREPSYGTKNVFILKVLFSNILTHEIFDSSLKIWWESLKEEFVKDKGNPIYEISEDTLKFEMPVLRERGILSKIKIYLKNPEIDSIPLNFEINGESYNFLIPPDTSEWFEFEVNKEIHDTLSIILLPQNLIFYADGEIPICSYYKRYGAWKPLIYGNLLLRPTLKYIADSLSPLREYKVYRSDTSGSLLLAGIKDTFFVDTNLQNEKIYTYFIGTVFKNPLREFIGNPYTIIFDYTPPTFSDTALFEFPDKYVFKTRIFDGTGIKEDSLYAPDFSYSISHDSLKVDTFFFTIPKFSSSIRFYLKAWDIAMNSRRFPETGFIYITEGLSGVIPHDTVFSGDVEIVGDIIIPDSVEVTLLEGTRFIFKGRDALKSGIDTNHIEIIVKGGLYSLGNSLQNVIFEIQDTGRWYGIRYVEKGKGKIEYSLIKNSIKGISAGGDTVYLILNEIRDNKTGIKLEKGYSFILANNIHSNDIGIESKMNEGFSVLSYNLICQNDSAGVLIKEKPLLTLGNLYNEDTLDDGANRIYENGIHDIVNLTPDLIYAQGNFWKSMDSSEIDLRIYDNEENPISGKVDFKDFYIWGELPKHTRWEGIISIGGDVIIPEKGKLEIVKGTKIRFIRKFDVTKSGEDSLLTELIVYGSVNTMDKELEREIANIGDIILEDVKKKDNLNEPIIYTSDGYFKEKKDWYGIVFKNDAKSKINEKENEFFKNTRIEYAYKGIEWLREKKKLKIKDSEVKNCTYGIYFDGKNIEIDNSKISLCDTGIYLLKGKGHIKETEVKENDIGIIYSGDSDVNLDRSYVMENEIGIYVDQNAQPKLKNGHNYICYNNLYNLYNNTSFDIDAKHNWWGTTNKDSITLFIYDFFDDSTKGIVYFEPVWIPKGSYASGGIQGNENKNLIESVNLKNTIFRKFAELEVILPEKSKFELKIYDIAGRKIREVEKSLDSGIYRFKIENLKKGVYFIEVKTEKIERKFKIIKI